MRAMQITRGDATAPAVSGNKIIAHVCNDQGGWGKGFVVAVSKRWPEPEMAYRAWYRGRAGNDFALGATQLVRVAPDTWVANMIGQHGMRATADGPPVRYDALQSCLEKLAEQALRLSASVHMPRIACGLAGGTWERVGPIVEGALCARDVAVTVYDFPHPPG